MKRGNRERLYDSRVTATAGNGQVELEWPELEDDVLGIHVYRKTSSFSDLGKATKVNSAPVGGTSYTDMGLTNGTTYYYRITGVDVDGDESDPFPQMSATPQDPPPAPPKKPYLKTFDYGGADKWEAIVIPKDIPREVDKVVLIEGDDYVSFGVWRRFRATPEHGKTTLFLGPSLYYSDFEPGTGLKGDEGDGGVMHRGTWYYPRYKLTRKNITNHWVKKGFGFSDRVDVVVLTPGGSGGYSGTSPPVVHRSREYFAGRSIIFSKEHEAGEGQKEALLSTIVHELTHAFGLPHRCGYYTFESPAEKGCPMNYGTNWVYAVEGGQKYEVQPSDSSLEQIAIDNGLHSWRDIYYHPKNDKYRELRSDPDDLYAGDVFWLPDSRSVQRFNKNRLTGQEIEEGIHLCAQHIDGIRRVHLEDNPALW